MSSLDTFQLRRAGPRDIDALVALERYFPSDRLRRRHLHYLMLRGRVDMFVIDYADVPIADAIVLYRIYSSTARLYSIVVHPGHRGKKLGERLLSAAELAAVNRGCRAMTLEVRPDNPTALHLYTRRGYEYVGRIERFYQDGSPALRLRNCLNARLIAAA